MSREVLIFENAESLCKAAAVEFVRAADEAVATKGSFTVALSGGSTPKNLYGLLATDLALRSTIPWGKLNFFFGDERHVPPDSPESNYRMAQEAMFSRAPIAAAQIARIKGEYPDAAQAAREYEKTLREFFGLKEGEFPRFDLVFLGMGSDGHTASLFPGTKALYEEERLVISNWVGKFFTERITLTAPVLNYAARVIFLVQGEDKAPALKAVLEGPYEPEQLPAQLIQPKNGKLVWLVDKTAARLLDPAKT